MLPAAAWANHASSTVAMQLPELKITSIQSGPLHALPSQCGEGQLRVIPCGVEDREIVGTVVRVYKDVKILGMTNNPSIVCQGMPTIYEKRHLRCLYGHQRPTVKSAGMGSRFTPRGEHPDIPTFLSLSNLKVRG